MNIKKRREKKPKNLDVDQVRSFFNYINTYLFAYILLGVQFTKEAKQAQWIGPSREKMENQKELIRRKAAQATATTHMLMPQEDKGYMNYYCHFLFAHSLE